MKNQSNNYTKPLIIIGILFFIFGFVTWINGFLIPYFKLVCELTASQAFLVTSAFYISYAIMAFPSAWVLNKTGLKNGMALGLMIMAIGALIFIPAAKMRSYSLFLLGLYVLATGLTLLQTASNPYVTILGPMESAAQRISFMGICNKVAGAIAPLLLVAAITKSPTELDDISAALPTMDIATKTNTLNELSARLINPYLFIAFALAALSFWVRRSGLPEVEMKDEDASESQYSKGKTSIFQFPHLLLGAFTLFLYVGVEVLAGDAITLYGRSLGVDFATAKYFTTFTLLAMILGYILGISLIPKVISQNTALKVSAILGIIFSLGAIYLHGMNSVYCVALLGLANALVWPALWPLSIADLGKFTKVGAALLIIGISGGAVIPPLYGWLSQLSGWNMQTAFWVAIPCYLFILYFAISGHKIRR